MRTRISLLALVLFAIAPVSAFQSAPAPAAKSEPDARNLTSEEAGKVVNGNYSNEVLGLAVKPIDGWVILSRGEMNVNEAFGREALGLKLGGTNKHRVFGMHNGLGSNVSVAIVPIPPDAKDIEDRDAKLIEYAKRDLPQPKITKEPVFLANGTHQFTGFRMEYSAQGVTVYQSLQTTIYKGFLVGFTTSSTSPQALSATLASLKKVVIWK